MLKGNDILGKPVIAYGQYQQLAAVEDYIFDHNTNQLLAFVIDKPGWRRAARIVPWSGIQSLTADAVIVWSRNMIVIAEQLYRVKQVLLRDNLTKGMPIITHDGRHLGIMTDVYLNEHTGTVLGYEVKGGLYADETYDCGFVPAPQTLRIHKNAAYVPSQTARRMEEHGHTVLVAPPSPVQALVRNRSLAFAHITLLSSAAKLSGTRPIVCSARSIDLDAELRLVQPPINSSRCDQFMMSALLGNTRFVDHDDAIGVANRGQSMGDDERRSSLRKLGEGRLDCPLCFGIERRSRFIQNKD